MESTMDPVEVKEFAKLHEMAKQGPLQPAEQTRWEDLRAKLIAGQAESAPFEHGARRPISRPG